MVLSMDRWVGKVAIVTGASAGIGAKIVDQLVECGVKVVGVARRVELMEKRAKELSNKKGSLHPYKADISKESDIVAVFKWAEATLGPVHILVNNAGVLGNSKLSDGNADDWRRIYEINVIALCIATREAVKAMTKNNVEGHIIHINSWAGHRVPNYPGMNVYPSTKFAVTALAETLRQELARDKIKIRVTSISPGAVISEMTEEIRKNMKDLPILNGEDCADAVQYALSTPQHAQVHDVIIKALGESEI